MTMPLNHTAMAAAIVAQATVTEVVKAHAKVVVLTLAKETVSDLAMRAQVI